jgi:predicted transcriptional regulator of viral defense system
MKKLTRYILSGFGGTVITKDEMNETCKRFGADVDSTVNFMIWYGYLVRILRGLYYVKTVEEFDLKKSLDIYKVLSLGLNKLKVRWYFGLYTGLRLNGLTHEFFDTIFILNDRICRAKEIKVGGEKVKFLKLSSRLVDFGIVNESGTRFSDVEKTILDFVYISRYRSVPEERITSMIEEYRKRVKTHKVMEYLKFYPQSVGKVVRDAGLV